MVLNKAGKIILAVLFFLSTALIDSSALADVNVDTAAPEIESTEIDKTEVEPGGRVLLKMKVEDQDSGVNTVYAKFEREGNGVEETVFLKYNAVSGMYEGTYKIPLDAGNGKWELKFVYANDNAGNIFSALTDSMRPDLYQAFTIVGGVDDTTPPEIRSIKIDKSEVEPGGQVLIQMKVEDQDSGVNTVYAKFEREGGGVQETIFLKYNAQTNMYEGVYKIPLNAGNGKWELAFVYANDNAGNIYSALPDRMRPDLYQYFTIEGGVDDTTPPEIRSIKLDKKEVEPGGQVLIQMEVVDQDAGVKTVYAKFEREGGGVQETVFLKYNAESGMYEGVYKIPLDAGNGKWELAFVYANDNAGNIYSALPDRMRPDLYRVFSIIKDIIPPLLTRVNEVTDQSTHITGMAEAGSLVTVKAGANIIGASSASKEGNYSVAISKQKAGTKLIVTAADFSGNISEAKEVIVKDVTPPAIPTVDKVTENTLVMTGIAEAGSFISVKAGIEEIGTATAGPEGNYKVTISKQLAGTELDVTATDKAGNVSKAKRVTVLDVTAPALTKVDEVTDKSTVVKGSAEAGSTITVKAENVEIGKGTADSDGNFEVQIEKQKAGTILKVTATDSAGNVSAEKEATVLDVTAPAAPRVNKVTDNATAVTGTTEAKASVTVKAGAKVIGSGEADIDGNYSVSIAKQQAGTKLSVAVTDQAGHTSEVKEVTVVDGTAPVISLMNKVTHHSTRVIGTAEPDAAIAVKNGSKTIGTTTADANGKYEAEITKQKIGVKLSITATDEAGNSSKAIGFTVADGNYSDLKVSHWALDGIMYLADGMIIGGYPNGSFQPEKNTTRAEAAKMLALALELPIESAVAGYKDVSSKHWAKNYIAAVSKAGLFNGNPDGTFEPDDLLTRAEMAKVISIAYDLEASSANPFEDVKNGHWAKGYISGLYENGITTGYSDKTFLPEKPTTRAEYSVFLARALNEDFR